MDFSKTNFSLKHAIINDAIKLTLCTYHFNETKLILSFMCRNRKKGVMMMVDVHRILKKRLNVFLSKVVCRTFLWSCLPNLNVHAEKCVPLSPFYSSSDSFKAPSLWLRSGSSHHYLFPIFLSAASSRFSLTVCAIILTLCAGSAWWQRVENGSSQ